MGTEVALGNEGAWVSQGHWPGAGRDTGRCGSKQAFECRGVEKGNAGSCQQGLGMLKQPGLGVHLVLSSKDCYGPQNKSRSQVGLCCINL